MKNAISRIAAVALLLVASEMHSRTPAPPFSLKLDVAPSNAKTGSNLVIEVDLTNNTNELLGIEVCLAGKVECNFEIYVRDSHGNSAPETRYLKAVRHEDTGLPRLLALQSIVGTSIEPGKTIKFFSELPTLFDLSHPDRYEIQVERWDSHTNKSVQSNVSHVTVSAQ
jgi:hypothetical protein